MHTWVRPIAVLCFVTAGASAQDFTLKQAMSAPFSYSLTPAPTQDRFAWIANQEGRRNLWVAQAGHGSNYSPLQITHYTKDDGLELDDLSWTPDGESIAYVRGGDGAWPSRQKPNPALLPQGVVETIWLQPVQGGAARKIGKGRHPVISPKSSTMAYLYKGQVWSVDLSEASAKPAQLFVAYGSLGNLGWSPDGKYLSFVSTRDDHAFVGIYSLAAKKLVYLSPSSQVDGMPVWSPDSKQVAFVRVPTPGLKTTFMPRRSGYPWSIQIADAKTGEGHELWHADPGDGSVFHKIVSTSQLVWSEEGYICFPWEKDGWSHLYSVSVHGGAAKLLTPGEFEVEHVTSSQGGRRMIYSSNQYSSADPLDQERRHIWTVNTAGGTPQQLTTGDGIETFPVVLNDDKSVAVLRSGIRVPPNPAVLTGTGMADVAPETIPADFPAKKFVVPQQVIFSSADGMRIHAQLFLPPNDQGKHPAVVFFHGGPMRQMLLGFHYSYYYSNSYAMNQYMASKGYVVLSVNYRTGVGYGMKFREAIDSGHAGASEFNDVEGAGRYLRSRQDVDPASIGAWGGSYGGYLTAHALARASDIFAAGSDMHGVHDWMPEMLMRHIVKDPYADPESTRLADISSPIHYVKTWKSPVLLIQGDDDRNVQFLQTVRLADALRKQGVSVEERIFPDEVHDFLLHESWYTAYRLTADFFDRKLPAAVAIKKTKY